MKQKTIYGDFYSPMKALSYHRPYIFSIGVRSIGKSTGWMIFLVLEAVKKGNHFIYMRRTENELRETAPTAIQNAVAIINRYYKEPLIKNWEYKNGKYYINDELVGYAIPLSLEAKHKSIDYSDVWYIVYDEFLVRSGKYLGNKDTPYYEMDCVESLFQTVDRGIDRAWRNETTMIFIGNNSTYYNPVFIRLGIDKYLNTETHYCAPKDVLWVVEQSLPQHIDAIKDYQTSNAYQLAGQRTKQYAFQGGLDDKVFVEKAKGRTNPLFNVKYKGDIFGIYIDEGDMKMYVSTREIKDGVYTFALTASDHSPQYKLMKTNYPQIQLLKDFYYKGDIKFENGKCKFAINQYFMFDIG